MNEHIQREKAIYWLDDDDLETIGIDPATISDEQFEKIRLSIAKNFDDSFQALLMKAVEDSTAPF
jgi:hypothetical protein